MADRSADNNDPRNLFTIHPRSFDENRYVYPVVSRRAGESGAAGRHGEKRDRARSAEPHGSTS